MKRIPLTQGRFTLVDDENYDFLSQHKWQYQGGYATRGVKISHTRHNKTILMHRVILNVPSSVMVDHRDRNPLNNQRSNLRIASRADNNRNVHLRKDNTSGYKGVSKKGHKWSVNIQADGKQICIGCFATSEDAAYVYDQAALQLFGEFAYTNFVYN